MYCVVIENFDGAVSRYYPDRESRFDSAKSAIASIQVAKDLEPDQPFIVYNWETCLAEACGFTPGKVYVEVKDNHWIHRKEVSDAKST